MEALRFASHRPQQSGTLVAISRYQAQLWQPYYPITQVIYNGPATTTEAFPGSPHHDGTLIFVGRMDPSKGVEDAIQVATDLGKILSIYGAPQPVNTTYFENTIQPLLKTAANVRYCGLVDQQTLFQALSRAQALLLPIKWDEPSGNVVLEAISCGTPAVMYNRGSAHEVIKHGVSGYVVPPDDLLAFATAVEQTETLDRMACASYAHLHFSQERCVQQYIDLFQSLAPEA